MADLTRQTARKFFASLYETQPKSVGRQGNFESIVTRLVATTKDNVSAGDEALQSLMFNYILSSPTNVKRGRKLTAVLGNIKQKAVMEFSKTFPSANIDELIRSAEKAGYDIEVLGQGEE